MSRPTLSSVTVAFGGLIALAAAVGIGRFAYTPILPPMAAALGFGKSTFGLIASANFAGYLAGALAAARTKLPGPRHVWLPAALVLSAATTAGMGLVHSVLAFILLRFLGGAASALALVLSSAVVFGHAAASGRPGVVALHFAGVGVGIALSAALVALLTAAGAPWQAMWLACGGLSLVGTVAVAALITGETALGLEATGGDSAGRDPGLWRIVVAYGLFGFGYVITTTFLVAIVRATPAIQTAGPVVWVVVGLAAAPSVMLWAALARRIGTANAFAAAALIEAVGVLASVVAPNVIGIGAAAVLVGGTFMGLTALGLMRGRDLAPRDTSRVMAAMTGAFGLGQIVGPALAGVVSDRLGGFTVPSIAAAGALVAAAWLVRR
jgi:predicted MFS family arabinose efflux permease